MKSNQPLKFTIHLSMFLRSFLVQALWNYRSMQSLGICFMLLPLRVKLDKSSEIFREFIAENIKFVNSHPYFAGYLVGMLSKLYLQEGDAVIQKAEKLKNLLVSPLGSIGDKLFWENIKPSMMLLAVPGAIFQLQGYPGWILMALAFAGYNLPHLIIRWIGIKQGYTLGYQIYNKLNFESFEKMYKLYLNILQSRN